MTYFDNFINSIIAYVDDIKRATYEHMTGPLVPVVMLLDRQKILAVQEYVNQNTDMILARTDRNLSSIYKDFQHRTGLDDFSTRYYLRQAIQSLWFENGTALPEEKVKTPTISPDTRVEERKGIDLTRIVELSVDPESARFFDNSQVIAHSSYREDRHRKTKRSRSTDKPPEKPKIPEDSGNRDVVNYQRLADLATNGVFSISRNDHSGKRRLKGLRGGHLARRTETLARQLIRQYGKPGSITVYERSRKIHVSADPIAMQSLREILDGIRAERQRI